MAIGTSRGEVFENELDYTFARALGQNHFKYYANKYGTEGQEEDMKKSEEISNKVPRREEPVTSGQSTMPLGAPTEPAGAIPGAAPTLPSGKFEKRTEQLPSGSQVMSDVDERPIAGQQYAMEKPSDPIEGYRGAYRVSQGGGGVPRLLRPANENVKGDARTEQYEYRRDRFNLIKERQKHEIDSPEFKRLTGKIDEMEKKLEIPVSKYQDSIMNQKLDRLKERQILEDWVKERDTMVKKLGYDPELGPRQYKSDNPAIQQKVQERMDYFYKEIKDPKAQEAVRKQVLEEELYKWNTQGPGLKPVK